MVKMVAEILLVGTLWRPFYEILLLLVSFGQTKPLENEEEEETNLKHLSTFAPSTSTKYMCTDCQMYLSKLSNVFV